MSSGGRLPALVPFSGLILAAEAIEFFARVCSRFIAFLCTSEAKTRTHSQCVHNYPCFNNLGPTCPFAVSGGFCSDQLENLGTFGNTISVTNCGCTGSKLKRRVSAQERQASFGLLHQISPEDRGRN